MTEVIACVVAGCGQHWQAQPFVCSHDVCNAEMLKSVANAEMTEASGKSGPSSLFGDHFFCDCMYSSFKPQDIMTVS